MSAVILYLSVWLMAILTLWHLARAPVEVLDRGFYLVSYVVFATFFAAIVAHLVFGFADIQSL